MRQSSFDFWEPKSTEEIIESLREGSEFEPLRVKPDGTVMQGNTRVFILKQRGVDVDSLLRQSYTDEDAV
jgi:hypothetical protein